MPYAAALVHISDIECGKFNRAHGDESDADPYMRDAQRLAADAQRVLAKNGISADRLGLVVSGDVASTGAADDGNEYSVADRILRSIIATLGVAPRHVAIVPGNHDVNRDACKRAFSDRWRRIPKKLTEEQIRFIREHPKKLEAFSGFANALLEGTARFSALEPTAFEGFLDLGVAVVGLDSTYACSFREEDNFGILHDRQLVGAGTLLKSLLQTNSVAVPIAVLHHSLLPTSRHPSEQSYLHDEAGKCIDFLLEMGFATALCGHEHRAATPSLVSRTFECCTAGAYGVSNKFLAERYNSTDITNKYQIILISQDGQSKILYRRLDMLSNDRNWVADYCGNDGEAALRLWRPAHDEIGKPGERPGIYVVLGEPKRLSGKGSVVFVGLGGGAGAEVTEVAYSFTSTEGHHAGTVRSSLENGWLADMRLDPGVYEVEATIRMGEQVFVDTKRLTVAGD